MSRKHIFVLAAFFLLFLASADLLVADLFAPFACDDSQSSGLGEDCFCCCAHIIVSTSPIQIPAQPIQFADPIIKPAFISQEPTAIYHPPRA